jgi:hypothetical protein
LNCGHKQKENAFQFFACYYPATGLPCWYHVPDVDPQSKIPLPSLPNLLLKKLQIHITVEASVYYHKHQLSTIGNGRDHAKRKALASLADHRCFPLLHSWNLPDDWSACPFHLPIAQCHPAFALIAI